MIKKEDLRDIPCFFCGKTLVINDELQMIMPHLLEPDRIIMCPMSKITLMEYAQLLVRIKQKREGLDDE